MGLAHLQQILALVLDAAFELGVDSAREPEQRHGRDALAGAGLADDAEHLAALEIERHAVDRAHDSVFCPELDVEVVDLEELFCH